jgi:glycosyltransferase involved in cell wall biosynthesis
MQRIRQTLDTQEIAAGGSAVPPLGRRHCMVVFARYPLTETRVQRQAEALVDAGYAVDVICLRDRGERPRERYRGVEIHRLPMRLDKRSLGHQLLAYARFFVLATARLTALQLRHRYHTVQVHNLPDFMVFCALVPKLQGVPVILDLHDLMPEFFAGRFGADRHRWLGMLIRWQERLACGFADHVVTVSEHWRRALLERGVEADRCSVVMNVADERIFTRRSRPPRVGSFELLYHGTVTRRYGLDLAIRAVDEVRHEIPGIRLTILGKGDDMPALIDLVRRLNLQDRVDLRDGFVLAGDLPDLIARADIGLAPYRNDVFTDGLLPTKLMEYAVMGLPSVAARTTAIEGYFRDSMVEFFTPGDHHDLARCLRELWHDRARLERLALGSRNFTERYNWTDIGRGYVELVGRLGVRSAPASVG